MSIAVLYRDRAKTGDLGRVAIYQHVAPDAGESTGYIRWCYAGLPTRAVPIDDYPEDGSIHHSIGITYHLPHGRGCLAGTYNPRTRMLYLEREIFAESAILRCIRRAEVLERSADEREQVR